MQTHFEFSIVKIIVAVSSMFACFNCLQCNLLLYWRPSTYHVSLFRTFYNLRSPSPHPHHYDNIKNIIHKFISNPIFSYTQTNLITYLHITPKSFSNLLMAQLVIFMIGIPELLIIRLFIDMSSMFAKRLIKRNKQIDKGRRHKRKTDKWGKFPNEEGRLEETKQKS